MAGRQDYEKQAAEGEATIVVKEATIAVSVLAAPAKAKPKISEEQEVQIARVHCDSAIYMRSKEC